MRDETDDQVAARLRAVLPGVRPAAPAFTDRSPLAWSDVVPSWPDDVRRDQAFVPSPRPAVPSSVGPIDPAAWTGERPAWSSPSASPSSSALSAPSASLGSPAEDAGDDLVRGAFDRGRSRIFDPGRRGAKALAAVAGVVVLVAGFLAWRARPQVDPLPPPSVADASLDAAETEPEVTSSAVAEVVVSVAGKVGKPGLVRLPAGSRVADAITAAGGVRPGVDVAMLNLARKVVDGELILVGVTPPPGTVTGGPPAAGGGAPAGGPVSLNSATLADLDTLPGVGPVLAQRILAARDAQGGFKAVSDLRQVEGIGDSRYEQLKDLVTL